MSVRIGILGTLSLVVDGEEVDVPGPKRRAVLAMLAITPGRLVPGERLLDAVWPDEVPASGRRALHSHMSRIRGHLGPAAGRLTRDGEAYGLDLRPGELDAAEARALAAAAAQAAPGDAVDLLARALGLWRGPALAEFADVAPLAAEGVALAEFHGRLTEDWLEARLALGGANGGGGGGGASGGGPKGHPVPDPDLLADATRAAAEAPLRERSHSVLVRALAGAGRQAEALRAAHAFRHRLADETGLSPGDAFDVMEQEVALGVLAPAAATTTRRPPARPTSPIVGREYEVGALRRHVTTHRLTSVVGPGGVGKTRLAMEVVAVVANGGTQAGATGARSAAGGTASVPASPAGAQRTGAELSDVTDGAGPTGADRGEPTSSPSAGSTSGEPTSGARRTGAPSDQPTSSSPGTASRWVEPTSGAGRTGAASGEPASRSPGPGHTWGEPTSSSPGAASERGERTSGARGAGAEWDERTSSSRTAGHTWGERTSGARRTGAEWGEPGFSSPGTGGGWSDRGSGGRTTAGEWGDPGPRDGWGGESAGTEVVVVELATVEDPARVADALADALGASERVAGQALDACVDALATRPSLVLLDNCEHVIAAARDLVAALLARCRDLSVVVTSREPLGLPDEHLLRLGPLPVPEEGAEDIDRSPAVAAFLAHARRRLPDLAVGPAEAPLVADLVRRLDGLPLALELAAGRVGTLALPDLHARLDRALDLFSAGRASVSARHRTLRAAIDWSYRDLDDDGQRLLRALGVFPGGIDLATAERLGPRLGLSGDPAIVLAELVEASMLVADPAAGRYRALETVRAFALDALEAANERDRAEAEMVAWAVDLARRLDRLARGPEEARADASLHAEMPNLAAAWAAAGRRRDVDARVALVLDLDFLRTYRGLATLSAWALALADDPALDGHPRRLEVLGAAGRASWMMGEFDQALSFAHQAMAPGGGPEAGYRGMDTIAVVALYRGDPRTATDGWEEAAALAPAPLGMSYLGPAALAAAYAGDLDRAAAILARADAEAATAARSAHAFVDYARAEIAAGDDPAEATEHYGRAIAVARSCGAAFVEGIASVGLVRLWAAGGRARQALAGYGALLESWRRSGYWPQLWTTLRNLAGPLAEAGQGSTAVLVLAAADAAPAAAAVSSEAVAAELAELRDRLRHELGDDAYASSAQLGARLSRSDVVDAALSAVRTALATH